MHYIVRTPINFDDLPPGSQAGTVGPLGIYASGLGSGGSESLTLSPVVTSLYPVPSPLNCVGPDDGDKPQFLSGNSDSIRFVFSTSIYAFGVYLIGNPSPTGDPAIPFWQMKVADGRFAFYTAYSDTTPHSTLGGSNDSVIYVGLPDVVPLIKTKSVASGYVRVKGIVTRVHGDRFNIQSADRTAGMAIICTGAIRGTEVSVVGPVGMTLDNERVIQLSQILQQDQAKPTASLFINTMSVGGSTRVGLQYGIPGSIGPNDIGLDGAICGKITAIAPDLSFMCVDDGANRPLPLGTGVIVLGETNARAYKIGDFVSVRVSLLLSNPNLEVKICYGFVNVRASSDGGVGKRAARTFLWTQDREY